MIRRTLPSRSESRLVALCLAVASLLLTPASASAQDSPCGSLADFPCGYQLLDHALLPAPTLLKLEARVADAGAFIGEAKFELVFVQILRGTEVLCMESFKNVRVKASVINLQLGKEMSCELGEVMANNADLKLQICIGTTATCVKPIPLASTPYAVRSSWAWTSGRAHTVDRAAQAHYTHRFTADRDMDERATLGTGYIDTETPDAAAAAPLYDAGQFAPYEGTGFMMWTPVRNRDAANLHIVSKDHGSDRLVSLDELILESRLTRTMGDLHVAPVSDSGLTVTAKGAHVSGASSVAGDLAVLGPLTQAGDLHLANAGTLQAGLQVGSGLALTSTLDVLGASDIQGLLTVGEQTSVTGDVTVTGDSAVSGILAVNAPNQPVTVTGDLGVLGATTADAVHVSSLFDVSGMITAPSAAITGNASAGDLAVAGAMTAQGDILFKGPVSFLGGTSKPDGGPNMNHVQYEGEVRDLSFGGAMTFGSGTVGDTLTGSFGRLLGARFQLASSAPAVCDASTEGMAYADMSVFTVRVCVNGKWKSLGGGGGGSLCGNGFVQPGEACDDGNFDPDDGCAPDCTAETGWSCSGSPSLCSTTCGDGLIVGDETCDDKNQVATDGCSATCAVLDGWECTGLPSVCTIKCGDGVVLANEACDDGNAVSGDGCSATCTVEVAWTCNNKQPSKCAPVPLAVAGFTGAAGPDFRAQGLALCAGAGPVEKSVLGKKWYGLCDGKGYSEIVFACSVDDNTTAEFVSTPFSLSGKTLLDGVCDDWTGAANASLLGDYVLMVDQTNPGCTSYSNTYEMFMHFGAQWACQGNNNTPGYLGQTGGRMWAFVRVP